MSAYRYERWDEELLERLRGSEALLGIFQELVLRTNGSVERALEWLRRLQELGHLAPEADLERFREDLERGGVISSPAGFPVLSSKGERMLRRDALERLFGGLKRGPGGEHVTARSGRGGERLPETRPWVFGDDPGALDLQRTMHNALRRGGPELRLAEEDFEVAEREHRTACATVLLLDISHSMILYGEDRITPAKRVALALTELIQTKYPKDSLQVALFGDHARELAVRELPYVGAGPYHTNTREALQLARRLLLKKRHPNRQIFMVTDGKPSAITEEGRLYKNPFGLDPRITNATIEEAAECRRHRIVITTFMLTREPALVEFVNTLTRVNRGRAYFSSADGLGDMVFVDFLKNRKTNLGH